ncbi:TetR family transcriptional regulator [Hamadaea tsunoensis]|uniref:TetR family transcriptional regulator n=1 Tax=Hamadaea tsunoensis TaxID=53368 RepID=UPI0004188179|nr:TetR family transcriptional regulator [Hamadaea tsunoensis]
MVDEVGLRERQRRRTQQAIQDAATDLFLRSGFDAVGVNEIAAAAEVSKRTLFKYFPSKEDLIVGSFADHQDENARVVAGRPPGQDPLTALREHFLDALARRDPITGLDDRPQVLAFVAMVLATPSLQARLLLYQLDAERALAAALDEIQPDAGVGRVAAYQIFAVQRALADENRQALTDGITADDRYPAAVAAATRAYAFLATGLAAALAPRH